MKVVIAIDSLKGSLSSIAAGEAAKEGILRVHPYAEIIVKPLADGGEGTVNALIEGLGAEKIPLTVTGPMGTPVNTYYGFLKKTKTAVMEMASAAGITLLTQEELNPFATTTFGVGEIILHALEQGAKAFLIGIGGSATNDGGVGMLQALGYSFLDENNQDVGQGGGALSKINQILPPPDNKFLRDVEFHIACDVHNPLTGKNGASYIFGLQKGLLDSELEQMDQAMERYASITASTLGADFSKIPGTGAAGGLGFAFTAFLNGKLVPGIDLILETTEFKKTLADTDIVITGEGRLDAQTTMGKAPIGVAKLAKEANALTLAFAGSVSRDANTCNKAGIDAFFPIIRTVSTLDEAMDKENARHNMADTVEQVFRLIKPKVTYFTRADNYESH